MGVAAQDGRADHRLRHVQEVALRVHADYRRTDGALQSQEHVYRTGQDHQSRCGDRLGAKKKS